MEEKLFNRIMEKEMSKEEELKIPDSINIKLGQAYEIIKSDKVDNVKKGKVNKRRNAIIAASLAFLVLTTVVVTPALADNIPPLKELSKYLKNIYSFNDNYVSNADQINMSKKYDGIEITMQGVIYDESSLKFIYTVTSEKNLQWGVQLRKNSLKVNGKDILEKIYSDRIRTEDTKISKDGEKLEKYAVITTFDISDLKLDDKVRIEWDINEVHTQNYKFAEGNWDFKLETSKELSNKNSKILNVNYDREIDGHIFGIDKIIITPTETKIISKYDSKFNEEYASISEAFLKDINNEELRKKFNKLDLIASQVNLYNMDINDEKGNLIQPHDSKITDGIMTTTYTPFKEIPKKIYITPFKHNINMPKFNAISDDQYIDIKNIKTPFAYSQGENMIVTINSMDRKDSKLIVNASFSGDFIASRVSNPFEVLPKGIKYPTNIDEMNKLSCITDLIKTQETWQYSDKANNENNTFNYEFNLADNKEYNLVISKYEFMKNKQIVVDVK
ncbi:DUF4179 domain-containing protein [Clostridium sp. YIM B02505]|uniref:DUF4179 domain-containing protein n=1 Tax=Clostridium yunnanense TaxID=2800325 RepID=A0ABS1EKK2_9CLOT|nr:DUF4179 domain-containing protein [Clostridium yunnanense]MBK1809879.1 DUF4179 domain-containing protein [Clostridium yunnanense]